jgi:hypothetical protein
MHTWVLAVELENQAYDHFMLKTVALTCLDHQISGITHFVFKQALYNKVNIGKQGVGKALWLSGVPQSLGGYVICSLASVLWLVPLGLKARPLWKYVLEFALRPVSYLTKIDFITVEGEISARPQCI